MDFGNNGGPATAALPYGTASRPPALARVAAMLSPWRRSSLLRRESAELDDRQLSDLKPGRSRLKRAIPIRSIGPSGRPRIVQHLLALDPFDRYLRFAYAATDEHVRRYAAGIDFARDAVFGIFDRQLEMLAMAHLAHAGVAECDSCLELGVSVAKHARGLGLSTRLLERAVLHARNQGVDRLFMRALSANAAVFKIARRAGATVHARGAESEAWLPLPAATIDSHLAEIACQRYGETDYRLKAWARRWSDAGA